MRDFNACYLLHSKHPQSKERTYIGFTVNPRRRIKQHNGVITQGAFKTSKWRPWEMLLVVYGFPTQVQALQFEWAWQHPTKSKSVRELAKRLGSKGTAGVKGKLQLMLGMLSLPPWSFYPLTLQYLSSATAVKAAGLARPPPHVKVLTAPLEDLPSQLRDDEEADGEAGGLDGEEEEGGCSQDTANLGAQRSRRSGGSTLLGGADSAAAGTSLRGASGSSSSSDEEGEVLPAGLTPDMAAPPDGKQWMCDICNKPIERHVLHCSCRCGFHLECLATQWLIESSYDPLSDNPVPSLLVGSTTDLLMGSQAAPSTSKAAGRAKGRGKKAAGDAAAGLGSPAGSGALGQPVSVLPEQGCCPSCGKQHRWLDLLSVMVPYGYPVKARKCRKRGRKQTKKSTTVGSKSAVARPASSRGRKAASSKAASSRSSSLASRGAGAGGIDSEPGFDMASLPTPKSSKRPRKVSKVVDVTGSESDGGPSKVQGRVLAATTPVSSSKRRGRPRKVALSDGEVSDAVDVPSTRTPGRRARQAGPPPPVALRKPAAAHAEVVWDALSSDSPVSSPAKGRKSKGRSELPPAEGGAGKVARGRKAAGLAGSSEAGASGPEVSRGSDADVKRPRGRPRKQPTDPAGLPPLPVPRIASSGVQGGGAPSGKVGKGGGSGRAGGAGAMSSSSTSDGDELVGWLGAPRQSRVPVAGRVKRPGSSANLGHAHPLDSTLEQCRALTGAAVLIEDEQPVSPPGLLPLHDRLRSHMDTCQVRPQAGTAPSAPDPPVAPSPLVLSLRERLQLRMRTSSQQHNDNADSAMEAVQTLEAQPAVQTLEAQPAVQGSILFEGPSAAGPASGPVDRDQPVVSKQAVCSKARHRRQLSDPPPTMFALQPVQVQGRVAAGLAGQLDTTPAPSSLPAEAPVLTACDPAAAPAPAAAASPAWEPQLQPTLAPQTAPCPNHVSSTAHSPPGGVRATLAPSSTQAATGTTAAPLAQPPCPTSCLDQELQPAGSPTAQEGPCSSQDAGVQPWGSPSNRLAAIPSAHDGTPCGEAEQPGSIPSSEGLQGMATPLDVAEVDEGLEVPDARDAGGCRQPSRGTLVIDLTQTPVPAGRLPVPDQAPRQPGEVEVVYLSDE